MARVLRGSQARRLADSKDDIEHPAARSTDETVVVVAHSVGVASRRSGRLDAADDALVGESATPSYTARSETAPRSAPTTAPMSDTVRCGRSDTARRTAQTLRRDLHTMPAQEGNLVNRCRTD